MPGSPDAKFGLSDPAGTDAGGTADDRIREANAAIRAIGAGTIALDRVEASKAGGTRVRWKDTSAGTDVKTLDISTVAGVSYVAVVKDDGTTARIPVTIDHATGVVTILAGKLVDGVRTVRGSLRGRINSDGTIAAGSGFTCSRQSTGYYLITPTVAFTAPPHVSITGYGAPAGLIAWVPNAPEYASLNEIPIQTRVSATYTDSAFMFEAKEF